MVMENGSPTEQPAGDGAEHEFGTCCEELKETMQGEEFEPLIAVGDDGVLYLSVGMVELENEDEPGMVDHPLFFCPFCGSEVQTEEGVAEIVGNEEEEDEEDDDDGDGEDSGPEEGGSPQTM